MIDYEVVVGAWPQPSIRIEIRDHFCAVYSPAGNEIWIDNHERTPESFIMILGHELAHWAHFSVLREAEDAVWLDALTIDSDLFYGAVRALELAASWSSDIPIPEHLIQLADQRRARRLVKHHNGTHSWRPIPLADPITPEEEDICRRLGAIQ